MKQEDMGTAHLNIRPKTPPAQWVCQTCGAATDTDSYDLQQIPAPDRCPRVYASGPCNGQIIRTTK